MTITSDVARIGQWHLLSMKDESLPDIPFVSTYSANDYPRGKRLLFKQVNVPEGTPLSTLCAEVNRQTQDPEHFPRVYAVASATAHDLMSVALFASEGLSIRLQQFMALPPAERSEEECQSLGRTLMEICRLLDRLFPEAQVLAWTQNIPELLQAQTQGAVNPEDESAERISPTRHPRITPLAPSPALSATAKARTVKAWRVPAGDGIDPDTLYPIPGWVLDALVGEGLKDTPAGSYLVQKTPQAKEVHLALAKDFHDTYQVDDGQRQV